MSKYRILRSEKFTVLGKYYTSIERGFPAAYAVWVQIVDVLPASPPSMVSSELHTATGLYLDRQVSPLLSDD